jgi:hypothetical protein
MGLGILEGFVAATFGYDVELKNPQKTDRHNQCRDQDLYERDTFLMSFHLCIHARGFFVVEDITLSQLAAHLK